MFNQTPQKIVQTNRLPFVMGVIILILVMGVFMYKAQMNQKLDIKPGRPRQSIDISSRAVETSWFNDKKFKNIKNFGALLHKPTSEELESQIISSQDLDLKKQEIEDNTLPNWRSKRSKIRTGSKKRSLN